MVTTSPWTRTSSIRQIELAKEKARIETDTTLAGADKQKQLADVSRRLAELDKAVSTQ